MTRASVAVQPGIDGLLADPSPIAGRAIGLVTNPSGVTARGVPSWKDLAASRAARLVRLFGPEHGVDGGAIYMESVGDAVHPPTGLPVVSLYGDSLESLRPKPEHLAGLGALVFDVQDVGARYYTFVWTMLLAMEACAAAGVRFVVLRPPQSPRRSGRRGAAGPRHALLRRPASHRGPPRHDRGRARAPARRGAADRRGPEGRPRRGLGAQRAVRSDRPAVGLAVAEHPRAAHGPGLPGMCLLEGTNLSEGRGTTRPFELFGAPWLAAGPFADALNAAGLPGARFLPTHFRPMFDKHAGADLRRGVARGDGSERLPLLRDGASGGRDRAPGGAARIPLANRALRIRSAPGDRPPDGLAPVP